MHSVFVILSRAHWFILESVWLANFFTDQLIDWFMHYLFIYLFIQLFIFFLFLFAFICLCIPFYINSSTIY